MSLNPLIPAILGVTTLLILAYVFRPLADFFALFYLMFIFINVENNTGLATFYGIGMLVAMVFGMLLFSRDQAIGKDVANIKQDPSFMGKFQRFKTPFLSIFLGVGTLVIMYSLQTRVTGSIIGVPSLSLLNASFAPLTYGVIGYAENRIFFTGFDVIRSTNVLQIFSVLPILSLLSNFALLIGPFFAVGLMFAIFHLTAYSLALSSLTFAFLVMIIWLSIRLIFEDELPAHIAHMVWNVRAVI